LTITYPTPNELRALLPFLTKAERAEIDRLISKPTIEEAHDPLVYDDPVAFLTDQLYIPETSAPITLHEEQAAVIDAIFQRDPATRRFLYSTIVYSSIKKSAKTTIGGGLALWQGWRVPNGQVYIVGNDLKQADSRMMQAIRYCVEQSPHMKARARIVRNNVYLDNGTRIEAVAIDPAGEAGGNPTGIFWTEAWGAKQKKHEEMWSEMTLSPTREGDSFKFIESYAGHSGESLILERLYEAGVKRGIVLNPQISPELYVNGDMAVYWNTRRYLPWQQNNPQYYEREEREKTPGEFRRQHCNEWATSTSPFVPIEWWDACRGDVPPLNQYENMVVAIDAAVTSDCFALVGISRREDVCYVRYVRVWHPPKGGRIDFAEPEAELRRLAQQYNVVEFTYDPMQMEDMAMRLRREGVGHFRAFNQGQDRLMADKGLFDRIRDRRVMHSGEPELRDHILNANQKSENEKLRIVKRAEDKKIDSAVACSMACAEAMRLNIG
jgi:phage terminase large subunit-like protein